MAKVIQLVISCDLCQVEMEAEFSVVLRDGRPLDVCRDHFDRLGLEGDVRVVDLSSTSSWAQRAAISSA